MQECNCDPCVFPTPQGILWFCEVWKTESSELISQNETSEQPATQPDLGKEKSQRS